MDETQHSRIIVGANFLQQVTLNIESLTNSLQGEQLSHYINNMIRSHGDIDDFQISPFFRKPRDVARYMVSGGKRHKGAEVNIKPVKIHYSDEKAIDYLKGLRKLIVSRLKTSKEKDIANKLWELNGIIARHNQDNLIVIPDKKYINKAQALKWLNKLVNSDSADSILASVSNTKKQINDIEDSKDNVYLVQGTGVVQSISNDACIDIVTKAERKLRLSILSRIGFKSCRKCGRQIFKIDIYCPYCGKKQSSIFDKWRSKSSHVKKSSKQ